MTRPGPVEMPGERSPIEQRFKDQLFTIEEVAAFWKVDPRTVLRWAHAGDLPAIRFPSKRAGYRFSENALKARMAELTVTSQPDEHRPRRGSDVEAWLVGWRDQYGNSDHAGDKTRWALMSVLLDDYRDRAHAGALLTGEVADDGDQDGPRA